MDYKIMNITSFKKYLPIFCEFENLFTATLLPNQDAL
jgi:hypothetical protein